MAEVHFTSWLREVAPKEPAHAAGTTVGYVLDDQGRLRKHVCIFADGERLANATALGHPIGEKSILYVMQALTGG